MKNQYKISEHGFLSFVLSNGGSYAPIIFPIDNENDISIMNSTLIVRNEKVYVFSRVCNYLSFASYNDFRSPYGLIRDSVHPETDRHLRSKTVSLIGDTDFNFTDWGPVHFSLSDKRGEEKDDGVLYHGIEDPRIVFWKDMFVLFGTVFIVKDGNLLGRIIRSELRESDGEFYETYYEIMPSSKQDGNPIEKNWMPFQEEEDTWLTWVMPNAVMKKEGDGYYREYYGDGFSISAQHRYRGGSQFIKIPGGWLGVVHSSNIISTPYNREVYKYSHSFVFLDDNKNIRDVSDPFLFSKTSCGEFCSGLSQDDDFFYMTFSIEDSSSNIIKFPKTLIL